MQRFDLINRLISKHGYTRYLEIGIDNGKAIFVSELLVPTNTTMNVGKLKKVI